MSKETKVFLGIIIGLIVIIGGALMVNAKTPGKYDDFAQCISDSGTKFYGAYWCPHCQSQKALFGKSVKKLPYVECAVSQDKQTQICIDNKIESYPTWEFSDGSRVTGELTFTELAEKTSCAVPVK
jgi:thiol-disulfide isomerase/thioredoxin